MPVSAWIFIGIGLIAFGLAFGLICDGVRRLMYYRRFDRMQRQIEEEFRNHFDEIKK